MFDLKSHVRQVQALGEALLRQAAEALGCVDGDFSTARRDRVDPDTFKVAGGVFKDVSAQIATTAKHFQVINRAGREIIRETCLIEVLREVDEKLAARFLELYEERLGSDEYDDVGE
jgi:hypothetical protein